LREVTKMNKWTRMSILSAAVAAIPLLGFSSAASAQYRVDTGHVNDANNRVGAGGVNPNDSAARGGSSNVTPNDIVYGNVTGGKQFRGNVESTDPRAFRGATSDRNVDDFIKQSSGSGPDSRMADTAKPFYGSGRAVPPPPGFVPASPAGGSQGGFVPNNMIENRPLSDQRLGDINYAQSNFALPAPGQFNLPGPVDPSAGQQFMVTASPLTGIQQINTANPNFVPTITNTQYQPVTGQLTPEQIQAMQNELGAASGTANQSKPLPPDFNNPALGAQGGSSGINGITPGGVAGNANQQQTNTSGIGAVPIAPHPLQGSGRPVGGNPLSQRPLDTSVTAQANNLNTQQSTRNRLTKIPPPQEQSALYAQLLRNHEQMLANGSTSDVQAQEAFNALQHAAPQTAGQPGSLPGQPGALPAQPGQTGAAPGQAGALPGQVGAVPGVAGATPGAGAGSIRPDGTTANEPPKGVTDYAGRNAAILKGEKGTQGSQGKINGLKKPEPVKVPSLATGVRGRGLEQILKNAEALMKEGKFTSALEQYGEAEQVAPNNPLIKLGQADAELGASYYARADAHLRDVLSNHPELLGGQYDLIKMLGQQRLEVLVKDLKEVAKNEEKEPRPVFLLAYIYYNIGDTARAEGYVDLADKRSGGKDPFYKLLRQNWSLPQQSNSPSTAPAAQPKAQNLNK
jgi:tetratricopeptide (TPR) repeat protein